MAKIRLRGGAWTSDPRLDRVKRFDPRSGDYAAVDVEIKRKKPRSYTWNFSRAEGNPGINQGLEGGCVGGSAANELALRPVPVAGLNYDWAREHIYYPAQRSDPWAGGAYPGASPHYEGTAIIDGAKAVRALGFIGGFEWAFGIDDAIMTLGHKGPIVFGLPWFDGMFEPDEKGFIKSTGKHRGDHAITGYRVNLKEEYVGLVNTWGVGWGDNGTCKISFADLDWLLRQDGEACVYVKRRRKAA